MRTALVSAALFAAMAGTAFAADIPPPIHPKAPIAVAPPSWTGCYVGVGAGYGVWNQDHTTYDAAGAPVAPGFQVTTGGRGWFGTAQVGCDYQFNQTWLVGVFGDANWGSLKGDFQDAAFALWGREKERWSWAAGGRVGYLIYPQLLGYVSAGYTQAHFDQVDLSAGGPVTFFYPKHTYDGWFLGTGYEYRLPWLSGFTWKTEYRFSDLSRDRLLLFTAAGAPSGFSMLAHKYEQAVRSELVWRFDGWR